MYKEESVCDVVFWREESLKGEKSSDMFLPQHIVVIKDTGVVFIRSAVP